MAHALTLSRAAPFAATAAAALAGGGLVGGLGAPAGWLSGSMIGVAALAAYGAAAPLPKPVQKLTVLLAGVGMGSGFTPATMHTIARYPLSLALLAIAIAAMTASSYAVLRRTGHFDRATAFFGAVPGALSYVFLTAADGPADVPRVAVIQIFRIFVLMAVVPMVARLGVGVPEIAFAYDSLGLTAALMALGALAALGLERFGVLNAGLYAGIFVSAAAHGTGLAPGRLAPDLQIAAQVLVGAWVGARFIGFDWRLLRRLVAAAVTSFLAAFAVAAAFAALATEWVGVPFADTLTAFAPGGLEAMTMMAFALGLDPLFIGAHHIARFLFISVALPWLSRRIVQA